MTGALRKAGLAKALLLFVIFMSWGCQPGADRVSESPPLKLSLSLHPTPHSGLIAVADEKGYFQEAGLEIVLKKYPSGRESLEAVCRGESQVATVADIALSAKIGKKSCVRVLASIGSTTGSRIVARRDRNIQNPCDLRGKRVGFSPKTVSDYFLYAFLISENIALEDVIAVEIPVNRQVDAVVNGEVDAVSAFEIHAFEAKGRLGENAVSWDSQKNLAYQWLLVGEESLTRSPEPLKRLLKALVMAEDFARVNEEETRGILARKWRIDPVFLRETWPRTRLNVSFGQAIVTSLRNYIQWQIRNEGRSAAPPDILNHLYIDALEEVAPKSVTIFR